MIDTRYPGFILAKVERSVPKQRKVAIKDLLMNISFKYM
jgi:hypothetical protein